MPITAGTTQESNHILTKMYKLFKLVVLGNVNVFDRFRTPIYFTGHNNKNELNHKIRSKTLKYTPLKLLKDNMQ